ncbi:hypothetical protein PIROE2DRAFT_3325 [Piromyces sp. E2]|nr:hypothetical protein PIROE2DRAFT_3325 [Piromyces sp. E2]|eukprot:OUM68805.1 hypothetical protein PIROE2DRAFT_3325 [Piromyces sp. E2]
MFSLASTATNAFSLPIGFILDRYGPRVSCYIGSVLFFFGCLLFGLSGPSFNGYLVGFLLLGIAGPFIFISVSSIFPNKSGLIMAALTGSFDATNSLLMPKTSLQWSETDTNNQQINTNEPNETSYLLNSTEEDALLMNSNYQSIISQHEQNQNREKDIKEMTSWEQMKTKEYITTEEQLQTISNDENGIKNTVQFFNIMLPLAGVLSIMPIGWLLDNFKMHISFTVLCSMALIFGIFS